MLDNLDSTLTAMLWADRTALVLLTLAGLIALVASLRKNVQWTQTGAISIAVLGPLTLGVCWGALDLFSERETLFWARLMAGEASLIFALGTLPLILASGAALACLSQICAAEGKKLGLYISSAALALSWIVLYLHPTPHYVPMPPWLDKTIWFGLLVGGGALCAAIGTFRITLPFEPKFILGGLAGLLALAPMPMILQAHAIAGSPMELAARDAQGRIQAAGCLVCHTAKGVGYPEPGGALESVGARTLKDAVAFLSAPTADTARELGIRETPTGAMGAIHLTSDEAQLLADALFEHLDVEPVPPPIDSEAVKQVFTAKFCLACHSLQGQGAPGGGVGGPLEPASKHGGDVLRAWMKEPNSDNAKKLGIRETPTGGMAAIKLTDEEVELIVSYLLTLKTE